MRLVAGLIPGLIGRLVRRLVLRLIRGGGWWRRGRSLRRPGLLAVDETLEFASVQEDPAAFAALIDMHTTALIGTHGAVALWADEFAHESMMWDEAECGNTTPEAGIG